MRLDKHATIQISRRPVGSSGSAATDQAILSVPHPAEASYTLRLSNRAVKPADPGPSYVRGA